MNEQRIKEVFSDEAFVKELFSLETAEEAQKALKSKNVDMSIEELNKIRDTLLAKVSESGELSLDALDEAAGGLGPLTFLAVTAALTVAAVVTVRNISW